MGEERVLDGVGPLTARLRELRVDGVEVALVGQEEEQGRSLGEQVLEVADDRVEPLALAVLDLVELLEDHDRAHPGVGEFGEDLFEVAFDLVQ